MEYNQNEPELFFFRIRSYDSFWTGSDKPHAQDEELSIKFGQDLVEGTSHKCCNEIEYDYYDPTIEPDVVLLLDRINTYKCWKKLKTQGILNKTVMVLDESGSVDWKCSSFFLDHFRETFPAFVSYRDDYIGNADIVKTYPVGGIIDKMDRSDVSFIDKRLLCMVCAKKRSHLRNEMYSLREKCIDYFEKNPQVEFDLYGLWWGRKYSNWRGVIKNKRDVYHGHKFALCIENFYAPGYITEKIYDCFRFGIVPVYAGPPNVTEQIPENCFVDFYRFSNISEMIRYLTDLSQNEYEKLLENAEKYISSSKMQRIYDNEKKIVRACQMVISDSDKTLSESQIRVVDAIDRIIVLYRRIVTGIIRLIN